MSVRRVRRAGFYTAVLALLLVAAVILVASPGANVAAEQIPAQPDVHGSTAAVITLPRTGQTVSYAPGDDGDIQAGLPWPDPRFTNADGSVPVRGSVIVDQLTGLMWTRDGGTPTVGACAGGLKSWQGALDYVACLNVAGYQGFADWRLPNAIEFESLVSDSGTGWLAAYGFNNPQGGWTSTSLPSGASGVTLVGEHLNAVSKSSNTQFYAWPVRSTAIAAGARPWRTGQTTSYAPLDDGALQMGAAWPAPRFVDNADGTVTDDLTGLMWLKDANCIATHYPTFDTDAGQNSSAGDGAVTWQHGLDFVAGMNAGSYAACAGEYRDWRMPNRKELISLADYSQAGPPLQSGHPFVNVRSPASVPPGEQLGFYWTATTRAVSPQIAYMVHMYYVGIGLAWKSDPMFIWPVRSSVQPPQPPPLDIVAGDTWRYLKGTAAPPAQWKQITFDDSGWLAGPTGIGYGDGDDATILSDMRNSYLSVYARRAFWVENPGGIAKLTFAVDYDDGFVAYLNGTEIARRNLTGTPPAYNQKATDHEAGTVEYEDVNPGLLVKGVNVLAIQIHNQALGSSDLTLIPQLFEDFPPPPDGSLPVEVGATWRYFKGTQNPPVEWKQSSFDDSEWNAGLTPFGYDTSGQYNIATVLDDMQGSYLSVFARKTFHVADPAVYQQLRLAVDYDDGFAAYINGTEVMRRYLPESSYDTAANPPGNNHEAGTPEEILLDPAGLLVAGDNTLAIQVHNISKTSSDLFLSATLEGQAVDDPLALVKGPYLQNVTGTSIVVMWQTESAAPGSVRYRLAGPPAGTWNVRSEPASKVLHEITVTGLQTGTAYEYQVSPDGVSWIPEEPARMNSAPGAQASFRAVVYGDTRSNPDQHEAVIKRIVATLPKPQLAFQTGDLVNKGKVEADWNTLMFGPARSLMVDTPLYPVLGNHEYRPLDSTAPLLYYKYFSLPGNEQWYAFSYGCARFIVLDVWRGDDGMESDVTPNTTYAPGTPQYTWLLSELQSPANQSADWRFVLLHNPPFTTTDPLIDDDDDLVETKGHPADVSVQTYLVPLFKQYGVDMVFSAHNHRYEHTSVNGVDYFVTAGGGSPFYPCGPTPWPFAIDKCVQNIYHYLALDVTCGETGVLDLSMRAKDGVVWDTRQRRLDTSIVPGNVLSLTSDTAVLGDWTNDGIFLHNWHKVVFNGSAVQSIGGDAQTAFYDLVIDKGATVEIPAANSPAVERSLSNRGTLVQTRDTGTATTTDFLQIGDSYLGLRITAAAGQSLGRTTVMISGGQTCSGLEDSSAVSRCFEISPGQSTSNKAAVRFYYLAGDDSELNGSDPQKLHVYRQVGEYWVMLPGETTREADGGLYDWVQVEGVDHYGRFTLGYDLKEGGVTYLPIVNK